ncbi:hypothetical protein N9W34_00325 [Rickettsiales bacterium]|nr:hypothetical protein [Rickettsiales bacterium]
MNQEARFNAFIKQLTLLSKEHGIAIQAIGGVHIFDKPEDAKNIAYSQDHTSGDLEYTLNEQE